ncbi:MAG TPA: Hpt domain-containing protein, partial [Azonexus sp.]|nr:Hpt domain-containing protein [Azonexus sp.]
NCATLAAAFASGDPAALKREVHTVKGLLATFSDDLGAAEALAVEQKAKHGEVAGLELAVAALQARLREVGLVLGNELGRLR